MQRVSPAAFRNIAFLALAVVLGAFYFTAPHALQFNDGLEFAAVSAHLGVAHPSGYPLYTLLGWIAIHALPLEPYHALLMVSRCAMLAALLLVAATSRQVLLHNGIEDSRATVIATLATLAAGLGNLFVLSVSAAEVYALNAMLLCAVAWLVPKSTRGNFSQARIVTAFVCAGLAAANHMTSLCIAPLLLLVVIAHRRRFTNAAVPFLCFALYATIPILLYGSLALRGHGDRSITWGAPYTMARLLDHVRGGEYRKFQFLMEAPNVPFTLSSYPDFLMVRVAAALRGFGALFFPFHFVITLLLGFASFSVLVVGFHSWLKSKELRAFAVGIAVAIAAQLAFIFTYNIPDIAEYFIGFLVLCIPFVVAGFVMLFQRVPQFQVRQWPVFVAVVFLFLALLRSKEWIGLKSGDLTEVWLARVEAALPPNAAVLTIGDYDLYPLWYDQFARHRRDDLFVFGSNFVRFPWFRNSLPADDARRDKIEFREGPPSTLQRHTLDLKNGVIDKIIDDGPVYTTMTNPQELNELRRYYRVSTVASLITNEEAQNALMSNYSIPPPYLLRIESNRPTP